jgi:succinate dehydrogenase/fumarate reductase flavoprotein subunit
VEVKKMPEWREFVEKGGSIPEWPYPIRYDVENEISTDVLILGGGIAGCHAAISAAKRGANVAVVDTAPVMISGCGGTGVDHWQLACTNPCCKISPEEMTQAVIEGYGQWECGIKRYIQCRESYDALLDCEKMGVQVRDINDEFKGAEFRDDKTRLMFAYEYENRYTIRVCGARMKPALYNELQRLDVEIYERVMATSLLTEGGKPGARVFGATGLNTQTGEFYVFKGKAVVMCMGNPQRLWIFSTELKGFADSIHDPNLAGAGFAMAWDAGAEFSMLEKTIPMPGGFSYPTYGVGNAANTWYACTIADANGKEIPWVDRDGKILKTVSERYRPAPGQKFFLMGGGVREAEPKYLTPTPVHYKYRGPRLIPDLPDRIRKGEFVLPLYADLPSMPEHERRAIFGLMVGNEGATRVPIYGVYTNAGFDPDKDMLQAPVFAPEGYAQMMWSWPPAPAQWREVGFCSGGGLVIDWDLKTTLEGMYAAGYQVLGGSEHSGAATTGRYAGRKAADYASKVPEALVDRNQVETEKARVYAPVRRKSGIGWKELHSGIARIMQDYCGQDKHESTIKAGLMWLKKLRENELSTAYARNPHELMRTLDCVARVTCGEMIMHACLARKASSQYLNFSRIDYPEMDPEEWNKFITVKLQNEEVKVGELPFNYWLLPPNAPTNEENYEQHSSL